MGLKRNNPGCKCCKEGDCCTDCKDEFDIDFRDSLNASKGTAILTLQCGAATSSKSACCFPTRPILGGEYTCLQDNTGKAKGCTWLFEGKVKDVFAGASCADDDLAIRLERCDDAWRLTVHSCISDSLFFCTTTGWEWFFGSGPDCDTYGDSEETLSHQSAWDLPGSWIRNPGACATAFGHFIANCFDDITGGLCPAFTDLDITSVKLNVVV